MADPRVILPGERRALELFAQRFPRENPVVFDVGANVGDYSQVVYDHFFNARVTAFEPQPEALRAYRKRFPQASCQLLALGPIADVVVMRRDEPASYHASMYRRGHEELGTFSEFYVRVEPLDAYVSWNNIDNIHLLKLDVEGSELGVLHGAARTLRAGAIKVIQFEFNENAKIAGYTFEHLWEWLVGHDFVLYREHDDHLDHLYELSDEDAAYEPERNYWAVHRSATWWWKCVI